MLSIDGQVGVGMPRLLISQSGWWVTNTFVRLPPYDIVAVVFPYDTAAALLGNARSCSNSARMAFWRPLLNELPQHWHGIAE